MAGLTKQKLRELAETIKVSDFADVSSYLAALYRQAKGVDAGYSYTKFSNDLGLGSSNAHSLIHGRRPLTEKAGMKICTALQLTGVQKRYLLSLIKQVRAKTLDEKDSAFEERLHLKRRLLPTELDRRQLAFFEHWYNAAILELLRTPGAQDNAAWMASRLRPTVTESEIENSLKLLVDLGYLAKNEVTQTLFPTDAVITTGNEASGLALTSYHRQMLHLSLAALDNWDPTQRDIGAVTIAVPESQLAKLKEELAAFRKKLLAMGDKTSPDAAERIVQINLQMFPLNVGERKSS